MTVASGHTVEVLEGQVLAKVRKDWNGFEYGLVRLIPGPWIFPKLFLRFADKFCKFQFRSSDVVFASYPKCGSTWMQEIIWTMRNNPDLTNPDPALPAFVRSPFIDIIWKLYTCLKEAWEKRNYPDMHIIFYEDLKADVMRELKRLNTFLDTKLTPQQLEGVARHTSFKEMKNRGKLILPDLDNPYVMNEEVEKKEGGFFRKGETGDWKDKCSPGLMAKMYSWIEKNIKSLGVDFRYTI